jgi:C-terminal processing protease CtpA/Prc
MKNSFFPLLLLSLLMAFTSCSKKMDLTTFFGKTPQLAMPKTAAFNALNPMQQDVEFLVALIKQAYPMWEQKITPQELEVERQRLLQLFAIEKDPNVMGIETQRLLARLKDGHSHAPVSIINTKRFFPLDEFQSRDSFFVANIEQVPTTDSALILGSLIEGINGFSRTEINAKIRAFASAENDVVALNEASLSNPIYLKVIGLATQTDSLSLQLKMRNGERRTVLLKTIAQKDYRGFNIKIPASPYKARKNSYNYQIDKKNDMAYLNVGTMLDFVCFSDGFKQHLKNPLLRPLAKAWMKKNYKKWGSMNFKKFAIEAIEAANTEGVKNMVIDLRRNGGGDERIAEQLFYLLDFDVKQSHRWYPYLSPYYKANLSDDAQHDADKYLKATGNSLVFENQLLNVDSILASKKGYDFYENVKNPKSPFYIAPNTSRFHGKVYVLTGPRTASAATIAATLVKDNALATVVGTFPTNKPTGQTGASGFKLPHSKVVGGISYTYVERPDRAKNEETALQPDVEVWQDLEDYFKGIDTKMAWIIKDIATRQAAKQ